MPSFRLYAVARSRPADVRRSPANTAITVKTAKDSSTEERKSIESGRPRPTRLLQEWMTHLCPTDDLFHELAGLPVHVPAFLRPGEKEGEHVEHPFNF